MRESPPNTQRLENESRSRGVLGLLTAGVLVLMLVGMLFVGEFVLRLVRVDPLVQAIRTAEEAGEPYDLRTRSEVLRDLRARGIEALGPVFPPALLAPSVGKANEPPSFEPALVVDGVPTQPVSGPGSRVTVLCNETGRWTVYTSDALGFRNPPGVWHEPRLALVGDSFGHGACVQDDETIAARLRHHEPATLNLSMSGNAPLHELAALREYAAIVQPSIVLWMFSENDLREHDLGREAQAPLMLRYLEAGFSQRLYERSDAIDRALVAFISPQLERPYDLSAADIALADDSLAARLRGAVTLSELRARAGRMRPLGSRLRRSADYDLFSQVLARARDDVAGWGGRLWFVYLPGVWHADSGVVNPMESHRREVLAVIEKLGIPAVDTTPLVHAHPDPPSLYSYRGTSRAGGPPHLGPKGYALVAAEIVATLGLTAP